MIVWKHTTRSAPLYLERLEMFGSHWHKIGMSSDRQIAANRLNAQHSTGPRSDASKQRVSRNALKHGLTGRDVVLPNEDPEEFDFFRAEVLADLAPVGALEFSLAEQIASDLWRLRRVPILEAALYRRGCHNQRIERAQEVATMYESQTIHELASLRVARSDRQAYEEAKDRVANLRAALDEPSFNVTRVLETSLAPLANVWRHEIALSRNVERALHELQRLQAMRAGQHVDPPSVVDVNINLPESPSPDEHVNGQNH
jgi:hypothetical protein